MPGLPYAKSFRELVVYQRSRELAREVFLVSRKFPPEERYSLTDQARRASRSIGAQVAEAWAKRRYPNHFVSKLTDADGEQCETQHWAEIAFDDGYIDATRRDQLIDRCEEVGRLLGSMMQKADGFAGEDFTRVKDDEIPYLVEDI